MSKRDRTRVPSRMKRDSFWFDIITGIAGNILYSFFLLILFIVISDQLSSWLASLPAFNASAG